jgi:hypothetical protein
MKTKQPYKQNFYKPVNAQKYIGNGMPFYRSGMELRFMRWCDKNPNVLKWSSESVVVPYMNPIDHKMHRYFIDNVVVIKEGDAIKKYLVEIKPECQTKPPSKHGNKKESTILYENATWLINNSKWEAAKKYAQSIGYEFLIITEKQLP